jgi:peroxiredoxin
MTSFQSLMPQMSNLRSSVSFNSAFFTPSCLSELKELRIDFLVDEEKEDVIGVSIQSPFTATWPADSNQYLSLLSSPNMSNDDSF